MDVEVLERPLPKPTAEEHVAARLLEALVEARLALKFLKEGLVGNAAGKAFQAWRPSPHCFAEARAGQVASSR